MTRPRPTRRRLLTAALAVAAVAVVLGALGLVGVRFHAPDAGWKWAAAVVAIVAAVLVADAAGPPPVWAAAGQFPGAARRFRLPAGVLPVLAVFGFVLLWLGPHRPAAQDVPPRRVLLRPDPADVVAFENGVPVALEENRRDGRLSAVGLAGGRWVVARPPERVPVRADLLPRLAAVPDTFGPAGADPAFPMDRLLPATPPSPAGDSVGTDRAGLKPVTPDAALLLFQWAATPVGRTQTPLAAPPAGRAWPILVQTVPPTSTLAVPDSVDSLFPTVAVGYDADGTPAYHLANLPSAGAWVGADLAAESGWAQGPDHLRRMAWDWASARHAVAGAVLVTAPAPPPPPAGGLDVWAVRGLPPPADGRPGAFPRQWVLGALVVVLALAVALRRRP